jgi:hypothetical protein
MFTVSQVQYSVLPVGASTEATLAQVAINANLAQAIARGNVANAFAQSFSGEVTTASAAKSSIGATAFTEQTAGAQRSIKSSSTNDSSAGTGARTVKITYFTLTGSTVAGPFTETITTNGTTAVNTVATNICFVEKIEVMTIGSTGSNVGAINLYSTTAGGGTIIASVAATDNVTKLAHHYVASGRTCMIYDIFANNDANSGNNQKMSLEVLDLGTAAAAEKQVLAVRFDGRSQVVMNPSVPTTVVGPARINAYVTPQNNVSQVTTIDVKFIEL